MRIHFFSKSEDNMIDYISEATFEKNKYIFSDNSLENVINELEIINEKEIILKRIGSTNMTLEFILNSKTKCLYENDNGVEFSLEILTKVIKIEEKKIFIEYDSFMDNNYYQSFKIWIIIFKNS